MKKLVALLVVAIMLLGTVSAMASTLTTTFNGPHFEHYYDDTWKYFSKTIAKGTHTYLLKNNSAGTQYTGATSQGTTLAKAGTATVATKNSDPSFSATVASGGKSIAIKFSGGSTTITYKDTVNVALDGTRTQDSSTITRTGAGFSASTTHNK